MSQYLHQGKNAEFPLTTMEETYLTILSAMRFFLFFFHSYSLISTLGSAASRVQEKQNNADRGAKHRHGMKSQTVLAL